MSMETQIRTFFVKHGRYPTSVDFCKDRDLPSYAKLKGKYKNEEINEIIAKIFEVPTYKELLEDYLGGRYLVFFKVKDVARGYHFSEQSFCRWLGTTKIEGYVIVKERGRSGVYVARKQEK